MAEIDTSNGKRGGGGTTDLRDVEDSQLVVSSARSDLSLEVNWFRPIISRPSWRLSKAPRDMRISTFPFPVGGKIWERARNFLQRGPKTRQLSLNGYSEG
mgnify:CR=1 FL=1